MPSPPDRTPAASIAVLGSKGIAVRLIEALTAVGLVPSVVVTLDDTADVRSRQTELAESCAQHGIPFSVAQRSDDAYAVLRASMPSVVLVAGWYRLIPDDVLTAIPKGFVGAHYSLLPRYRGSAPVVWQLINGEAEIGYSLFQLGPGMDEGELAGSGSVTAGDGYVGDVLDRLDKAALNELTRIAPHLAAGTHQFRPQPDQRPSYVSRRTPADGRIDWGSSATEIVRAIRAQSHPYPGAWSTVAGVEARIWRASVEDRADYFGIPGNVVRLLDGGPVVACGAGGVLLEDFAGPPVTLATRFV